MGDAEIRLYGRAALKLAGTLRGQRRSLHRTAVRGAKFGAFSCFQDSADIAGLKPPGFGTHRIENESRGV
jgi:hypothetical protein